ncbi:MAG: hypothetical protein U9M90_01810 [Patescibacteria group bacterium]|nr:hypothetical protein [Patescibacteria group bacterium]
MKTKKVRVLTMFFMIVCLSFGVSYADSDVSVEVETENEQSLWWDNSNHSVIKDNVSVGSWLHASGMSPGLPDIPLYWKLAIQQYNEATPDEIFGSMPETITRENIAAYYATNKETLGYWKNRKLARKMNKRPIMFVNGLKPTNALKVFPGYPNTKDPETGDYIAKKGREYKMIGRLIFNSEDEIVYRDDLAVVVVEWAMDRGADAIIVTGWGARRVFDTNAGALSLLTAFGQVFTNSWTGAINVSPGAAINKGSNQTKTLPYLRVAAIDVKDSQKFILGMLPQKAFDDAAKKLEQPVDEDLTALREQIKQRSTRFLRCPDTCQNNANLRYDHGMDWLILYTKTKDRQERDQSLVNARDNFAQALRNGLIGERAKETHGYLASIWYAMAQQVAETKRETYYNNVRLHVQKAGITEIQILKVNE